MIDEDESGFSDVDPPTLQMIGWVAVEASGLEWLLANLVAAALKRDNDWVRETLSRPGAPLAEFEKFVSAVDDAQLAEDLDRSLRDAKTALSNRNGVIHSIAMWVIDEEDGRGSMTSTFWHPRTNTERPRSASQIGEIAHEIRMVYDRASAHVARIEAWAAARNRGPNADQE